MKSEPTGRCEHRKTVRPRGTVLCGDQLGYPNEVIADQVEQEVAEDAFATTVLGFAHGSVLLAPSEDAFDHGPACLRHAVTGVPGGAIVDGTLAPVPSSMARLVAAGCSSARVCSQRSCACERDKAA